MMIALKTSNKRPPTTW